MKAPSPGDLLMAMDCLHVAKSIVDEPEKRANRRILKGTRTFCTELSCFIAVSVIDRNDNADDCRCMYVLSPKYMGWMREFIDTPRLNVIQSTTDSF